MQPFRHSIEHLINKIKAQRTMVFCVGLTGNIASGKTTVTQLFSQLGVEIISADCEAKALTTAKGLAYDAILNHFGQDILDLNQEINRLTLRNIIFSNPHQRLWLEQLLHPLIRQRIEQKIYHGSSPYCIIEIPLLKNREQYPYLNKVLVVVVSKEIQIARLMARDACSREQAMAIIATQPTLDERRQLADDIILNDGQLENLKQRVLALHQVYLQSRLNSC